MNVSLDTSQLKPGTHSGKITIKSDPTVQGNTQTINVLVAIADKATPKCLPNTAFTPIKTTNVQMEVKVVSAVNKEAGGCDIAGIVDLTMPQNKFSFSYAGQINGNNKFQAVIAEPLTLDIAKLKLKLSEVKLDDASITGRANLSLEALGGGSLNFSQVRIDSKGLRLDGNYTFPLSAKFSLDGFDFSAEQATLRIATSTSSYELDIKGKLSIRIPASPIELKITATINKDRVTIKDSSTVSIPDFNIQLAGLTFTVKAAKFGKLARNKPLHLFAKEAFLKIPKEWGGTSGTVYDVRIYKDGSVIIGGGAFDLPPIKAGGFNLLKLKGGLKRAGNGYEIEAKGEFQIVAGAAARCGLTVGVVLYAGVNGASIIEMHSNQTNQQNQSVMFSSDDRNTPRDVNAFALREFDIRVWDCWPGIPIGNSGLYVTGIRGKITLRANIQSVSIEIQVQSFRLLNRPLIYTEGNATLARDRTSGRISIDLGALVRIVGIEFARTNVKINDELLDATLEFTLVIIDGRVRVFVGRSNQLKKMVFGGSGMVRLRIKEGAILKECVDLWVDEFCLTIPPFDFTTPSINADFGTFTNNAIGFKGYVDFWGWQGGYYYDTKGRLSFGSVNKYKLALPGAVRLAKRQWEAQQRGEQVEAAANVDQQIHFSSNGTAIIDVPINQAAPQLSHISTGQPVTVTVPNDLIFVIVQPLTGTLKMNLSDPAGNLVTPEKLPSGIQFIETTSGQTTQGTYFVKTAAPGIWQIHLEGDVDRTDFVISVLGNNPVPSLADLSVVPTGNPNLVGINWRLLAAEPNTKISIYATEGPITETMPLTDANGNVSTTVIPYYAGLPVAVNLSSATNGSPQSQIIDLSHLPSGIYSLWLSAEDAQNPSVNEYVMQGAKVARVAVVHNHDYPTTWTSVITPTSDSKDHTMHISWQLLSHPDIDSYAVSLRTHNPLSPTEVLTDEIVVSAATAEVFGSAIIDGVTPGQAYIFTVCAQDEENLRRVCSAEQTYTPPQPDFLVSTTNTNLTMSVGQTIVATIKVETPDDLSYPIGVEPDYELLPDGFEVLLESDETVMAAATSEIPLYISADAAMLPGDYTVPIIAYSGNLERDVVLNVQVLPGQVGGAVTIFMPIIMR